MTDIVLGKNMPPRRPVGPLGMRTMFQRNRPCVRWMISPALPTRARASMAALPSAKKATGSAISGEKVAVCCLSTRS